MAQKFHFKSFILYICTYSRIFMIMFRTAKGDNNPKNNNRVPNNGLLVNLQKE